MDTQPLHQVGQRLGAARLARGLSQLDLALQAGVDASTVVDIEGGVMRRPQLTALRRLATVLGVRVPWLQTGAGVRAVSTLGQRLRSTRAQQGLTLAHVATLAGVTIATLWRLETGRTSTPHEHTVAAVARALQVDPAWLTADAERSHSAASHAASAHG